MDLAAAAGLSSDEHGNYYDRGDHTAVSVVSSIHDRRDLRKAFAAGDRLLLVAQRRRRVYAKSSTWYPSDRTDKFLVGRNESGSAFAHAVPANIGTVTEAVSWIWAGADVLERHGDVAIVATTRAIATAIPVPAQGLAVDTARSHMVLGGEYRRNGALYIRDAVLHHTRNQHPDVVTPPGQWVRVVVGRRSTRAASSTD